MPARRVRGELDGILERLEPLLGSCAATPEPLLGGITNHNYRARFGERDCVIRRHGRDTRLLGIDRESERVAAAAAAELGIGPTVLAAFDDVLVTAFVQCDAATPTQLDGAALERIGHALRRFHDLGPQLRGSFNVPALLEHYARLIEAQGGDLPQGYEDARRVLARIERALEPSPPVPCHNDLLPGNLLRGPDGALLLVDWEYAAMGERFFDLGNLAVNNGLDHDGEERLLCAYLGTPPTPRQRARLALMRIASDAREAAWGAVQVVLSELEFDFDAYAHAHFERLSLVAQDPRMEEWLAACAG